ncbi:hypothetical protein AB0J83_45450 [Actinoplanes sp. NPDC049596]|uniref:hypothetical protein n=1 Tax=unclassified Actinoplanes TaxID=2626549 RepID=UPI0034494E05
MTRFVIGLDIGDGESCLGWAPADRSEPTRIYTRPRSGERSIVTAMAQSPSGRLIGDEAVVSPGATHFGVNFKSPGTPDAAVFAQTLLTEFRSIIRKSSRTVSWSSATRPAGHPRPSPPTAGASRGWAAPYG